MSNTIRVTPEVAKETAEKMLAKANELKDLSRKVTEDVDMLQQRVWSGDAQRKYKENFWALQAEVDKLIVLTADNAEHLKLIAADYEKTETTNTESASALDKNFL